MNFTEFTGESEYDRRQRGSVEFAGEYVARSKPVWLVLGKIAVVAFVVGFGYLMCLRHIDFPFLQVTAAYFGVILIYCGLAYVVRPNPNNDNLGWGGGLINDPTQYSDNINRGLRDLECLLQPGQLATESVLDLLILFEFHRAVETTDVSAAQERDWTAPLPAELPLAASATTGRVLPPDRFDRT